MAPPQDGFYTNVFLDLFDQTEAGGVVGRFLDDMETAIKTGSPDVAQAYSNAAIATALLGISEAQARTAKGWYDDERKDATDA